MSRRWLLVIVTLVLCNTLAAAAVAQDSGVRTLFGNWFGKKDDSSAKQEERYNQRGNARQSPESTNNSPQASSRSQANTTPPDPSTDDGLPGLGGSPLPKKGVQASRNGSATKNGTTPQKKVAKTPQANGAQPYNAPSRSFQRDNSRKLDVSPPNSTPTAKLQPENSGSTKSTTSTSRQSPSRRTAPHANPGDLRNELSGSFGNPVDSGEPVARTARANEQNKASSDAAGTEKPNVASENPIASPVAGTPSALPINELPTPTLEKSATTAPSFPPPKSDVSPSENEPRSATEAFGLKPESRPGVGASRFVRTPYSSSPPAGPQTARGKEAFGEALQVAGGGDPNVLASNQTPILNADIRGPKQILIGREAVYRVRLQNQSDIPAEGVVATVRIPPGADVVNATATQGMVQQSQDAQTKGQMQWQIARLDRHAGETLEVRIIPRENRPLELGVTWTVAPVGSRAVVEVQEPKLQLEVNGPSEVHFDRPQVFKLTISNPGTGPAENVKIELVPPSGNEGAAKETVTSHPLGDLPPGASQTVEVELTAREAGKMFVKATATAEGGLTSNASKEVLCRKPELEVDWRGPATKYAGTLATYFVRVRNPGTAPAEDVTVKASLPEGAEFTSASEGQIFDSKTREVAWHVGTLRPGDDNYMELKCVLKTAGTNQLKISAATAAGNLTDTKTAATNVVALADLKLDVSDPSGPVAVGSTAIYEIHITNRGASSAKDVQVVGLFSEGIEPEQAEGAVYTVADGRVSFKTMDVPPGRDIVLRIRTHAVQPGTHVFRAEVLCRDLEIKLAAEETTRFYTDDVAPDSDKPEKQAAGRSDAFKSTVR
jgi:uncharacterized repeat protein (TIGR01451 family)